MTRARGRDADMTQGNILRQYIDFALPLTVGLLFQQLYSAVDSVVVGNFVGETALGAVGSTGNIINMLIGVCNGLSLGADDYIFKPFGVMELRARITAHLRREHRERSVRLAYGRACFNLSQKQLLIDNVEIALTRAEYEICEFLAKNRGQVFSKEQILEEVLGFDSESNDSTIVTHIKNIRTKFADYDYAPIKTVWGIGYKWEE